MGFNLIYWNSICNFHFLEDSLLEKCGKIWKNNKCGKIWKNNSSPPPRLRPDWGNIARVATTGLGSIGLILRVKKIIAPQSLKGTNTQHNGHMGKFFSN